MLKAIDHQPPLVLILTTLSVAVLSGLFVVGVGSVAGWFLAPLAVSILFGILLTQDRGGGATRSLQQYWRNIVLVLCLCCIISLSWLVLQRKPLPLLDLGTAALVTVLFSLLAIGLVLYFLRLSLLSFPSLFLGTTFLFTCSPLIMYQYEDYDAFQWWKFVDTESILRAMPVVMLAFASFLVGALFAALTNSQRYLEKEQVANIIHAYSDHLRKVGLALYFFSISVVIIFTLQGSGLSQAFEYGYQGFAGARKEGEMPRLVVASLSWFLPWSLLILTATSKNRRLYIYTLLLTVPACVMMFMTGDRTAPLAVILLVASGSPILGFPIDWKRSFAVVAFVGMLVPTVVNLRSTPVREWSVALLVKAVTNEVEANRVYKQSFIAAVLTSTGTSYQTLMGTIMLVPDGEPYRYGFDYLRAPIVALPYAHLLFSTLGIDLDAGEPSDWLKARINPDGWSGQGYLQVAEAYLQFGVVGVIGIYMILGVVLVRLWWYMQLEDMDSRKLALALLFMMAVLTWIRNEAAGVIRPLLWGALLIYVLPAALDRQRWLRAVLRSNNEHAVASVKARS